MVDPAPGEEAALPARRAAKRGLDPEAGCGRDESWQPRALRVWWIYRFGS